ncbi:membrane fusion protein [Acinetobacter calcoaceticus]|uniref:Membrane fusion protein n=1 Tax=Acinetobacter calcoaceticus TaxID=471 RepID=A0A4R1Y2R5_ACICA|nr:membrane fusion protein [Acinetobacter calcoaceticus]
MDSQDSANKIFRQDFIDAKKNRWLGQAVLISAVPTYYYVLSVVAVIILLLGFIIFAQFTRRIQVTGEVVSLPQPNTIIAPQQGTIIKTDLTTGQFVKKGQALLQLDVSRNSNSGNSSQHALDAVAKQLADVESIMQKLKQNKATTLANLSSQLEKTRVTNQHSIQRYFAAQKGLSEMQKIADDYARYLKQGLVNREQVNQLRYLYFERQNAVENLYSQLTEQSIRIQDFEKEIATRGTEINTQILQYQVQYNDLLRQQTDLNASHVMLIKAPQSGFVENMIINQGQMVNAGDSLLQLSPSQHEQFSVILWLPNHSIPYIQIGDAVNLRYQAFPFEKFGQFAGKIEQISRVPATDHELARYRSAPKNTEAAYYKVSISPAQHQVHWQQQSLRLASGMQTDATLFLEKRPIYQWILAPLYELSHRVTGLTHE